MTTRTGYQKVNSLRKVEVHDRHGDTREVGKRGDGGGRDEKKKAENAKLKTVRHLPSGLMSLARWKSGPLFPYRIPLTSSPLHGMFVLNETLYKIEMLTVSSFVLDIRTRFCNCLYPPPEGVSGITSRNPYPVLHLAPAQ